MIFANPNDQTYGGNISGSGNLTKTGGGVLILTSANIYTGSTTINGGMLLAKSPAALPGYNQSGLVVVNSGGIVGVSVGAASSEWATTDIDLLLSKTTINAGAGLGIDTTDGNFTYSSNLTGAMLVAKSGTNTLTLTGINSYTGGTTINGGMLQFDTSAGTCPSTGSITINSGGILAATGPTGYTTTTSWLTSGKITSGSQGVLALTADEGGINMTGYSSLYLGARTANPIYSGTLTPDGTTYRLGGGPGTLSVSSALTGTGKSLIVGGNVVLTGTNSYTGGTTINGGMLQFDTSAGTCPSTGSITINSGGTLAATGPAGYTTTTSWLTSGKITSGSQGVLALTADEGAISMTGYSSLYLGAATANPIYSGALTPDGTTYRLGGGPGTLSVSSALTGTGKSLIVGGNVVLTGTNSYSGTQIITAGKLDLANQYALQNSTFIGGAGALIFNSAVSGHMFTLGGMAIAILPSRTMRSNCCCPDCRR